MNRITFAVAAAMACWAAGAFSGVLVEAESFASKGGWRVDPQFTESMGSPYLLAHGLGRPVENARTTVTLPAPGTYHVWVRAMDWVPGAWEAPGRFRVLVDGRRLDTIFGTVPGWGWQHGGPIVLANAAVAVELKDLTGFDGRCDAIYFGADAADCPPSERDAMAAWRRDQLGLSEPPPSAGDFDVVVVGGGIAGCAAAIAAGREGMRVALIHDRPVLGGNASREVRVHTLGIHGKGGDILKGLETRHWPNGSSQAIEDSAKRHRTMATATNVHMFLSWRAIQANTRGDRITSVDARHIESGETKRVVAPIYIDCTGDGWIGYWAGADYQYGRESRDTHGEGWVEKGDRWSPVKADAMTMGSSLLWNTTQDEVPCPFPPVPWAMDVAREHAAIRGGWNWEYAAEHKHQVDDAEAIRDHMLRAIYGSFSNAKERPVNRNLRLSWVGYIAGKRESRRLIGDYIFTQDDVLSRRPFKDAVVEERRDIDVHYQKPDISFRSAAIMRKSGGTYYIPFRALYSRNITNLMMAGRCFSCSHIGLGGPRIMLTTGQMGIATGYAAALCRKYDTRPRGIYENHMDELRGLIGYTATPGIGPADEE